MKNMTHLVRRPFLPPCSPEVHRRCSLPVTRTVVRSREKFGLSLNLFVLLQLKKGGVTKAKGEGEKEKECTKECKSRRRRDEKPPWALNYESGEGGGVPAEKGRSRSFF